MKAGSILPPEAIKTASIMLSSTPGKASFNVTLACSIGLRGLGGIGGGGCWDTAALRGLVDVGVGSKVLSSSGGVEDDMFLQLICKSETSGKREEKNKKDSGRVKVRDRGRRYKCLIKLLAWLDRVADELVIYQRNNHVNCKSLRKYVNKLSGTTSTF